ncbi:MAG: recombinase family protein [Anaeroplasma sp.]|nr:recombinase family protein [Anaeroplasma sp.]
MASIGKSSFDLANILTKRKILKPRCYMYSKYKIYSKDIWNEHPYDWRARTIARIVENYEYCGHMVSNKNYKVSYKSKRLLPTDKKNWIIVKNTHDAIISEDLFNKANERIKRRKRVFKNKERNMFSGIIRCATYGKALSLFNGAKGVSHFACSQYRSFGKSYCSCHYIRYDTLCKTVEDDIKYHINLVTNDKDKLIKDLLAKYNINNQVSIDFKRLERRKEELKVILKRMYEDMILGKVSEIMYNEISKEYEIELTKISDKIEESSKLNKDRNELGNSITKFIDEVSKYSLNDSLSKELLNKLIKEIRVHESEVIDGKRVQNVEIIYNFMP